MRTEQLRSLLVIEQTASLRVGAKSLGMSQSTLSTSIQRLEDELGVQLLQRSRQGTSLTPVALALLDSIRKLSRAEDEIRQIAAEYTPGRHQVLRVSTVTGAVNTILPRAMRDVLDDTDAEVQIRIGGSDDVVGQILDDSADLGIIACAPGDRPCASGLHSEHLLSAPVGVAMTGSHPLAVADRVSFGQLTGQRIVQFREGYLMHAVGRRLVGRVANPRVVSDVESTPEAVRLVSAGIGVCFVPSFSIGSGEPVVWRALTESTEVIALVLIRRTDARVSARSSELQARLRWYAAETSEHSVGTARHSGDSA